MKKSSFILASVILASLLSACGHSRSETVSSGAAQEASGTTLRRDAAIAWTGDVGVVFGGVRADSTQALIDGEIVDARGSTLALTGPAPFSAGIPFPTAVSHGGKVYIGGVECERAVPGERCEPASIALAEFDPASRVWTRVDLPDGLAALPQVSTDGSYRLPTYFEILGVTLDGELVVDAGLGAGERYWVYEIATDSWADLPPPPVEQVEVEWIDGARGATLGACLTSTGVLVVFEGTQPSNWQHPTGVDGVRTHVLDMSDRTWVTFPPDESVVTEDVPPVLDCAGPWAILTATEGQSTQLWQLDPATTKAWTAVPSSPAIDAGALGQFAPVQTIWGWTGSEIVVPTASGTAPNLIYEPGGMTWRKGSIAPAGVARPPTWSGDGFIGLSATGSGEIAVGALFWMQP